MAGMTDTAFRRLVKRQGGCGLVVTEMVSSEGLVRGIDRTLEYAEYTEEERPVSIQIFGGDPAKMADAAQIVEGMGADIVDINMGCPVPKIAKHNAGCSLMREPAHAASVVARDGEGGADSGDGEDARRLERRSEINAPMLARMVEDAGAAAVTVHGRTAAQAYTGMSDWELIGRVAAARQHSGVRQRRLRRAGADRRAAATAGVSGRAGRPRRAAQSVDLSRRRATLARARPPRRVTHGGARPVPARLHRSAADASASTKPQGFRHVAPRTPRTRAQRRRPARGRERWVINKLRALILVHQGTRRRLAACASRSTGRIDRRSSATSSTSSSSLNDSRANVRLSISHRITSTDRTPNVSPHNDYRSNRALPSTTCASWMLQVRVEGLARSSKLDNRRVGRSDRRAN